MLRLALIAPCMMGVTLVAGSECDARFGGRTTAVGTTPVGADIGGGTYDDGGGGGDGDGGGPVGSDGGGDVSGGDPGADPCTACGVLTVTFGDNTADTYNNVATDTYIGLGSPDANHGSTDHVWVVEPGAANATMALFRFDVSAISTTATVLSARLHLWNEGNGSTDTLSLLPILEDWQETTVTWNERISGVSWSVAGCGEPTSRSPTAIGTFVPQGGIGTQYVVDLDLAYVQGWVDKSISNYGVVLVDASGTDASEFWTREYSTDGQRPSLEISYR